MKFILLLLFVAAAVTAVVIMRKRRSAAPDPTTDEEHQFHYAVRRAENKLMLLIAVTFAVLLIVLSAPMPDGRGWLWLLPMMFIAAVMVTMAIDLPENNIGYWAGDFVWGKPADVVTDPAAPHYDPRVIPGTPEFNPKIAPPAPKFRPGFHGALIAAGLMLVFTLLAWAIMAISSLPGTPPSGTLPRPSEAIPATTAPEPTNVAPVTTAPTTPPTAEKVATCDAPALVEVLGEAETFNATVVEVCIGDDWMPWTEWSTTAPQTVNYTHTARDGRYGYVQFGWKGHTIIVRFTPTK